MANTQGAEVQWNGDWSRSSPLWTKDLKVAYLDSKSENEFFMPFDEYLKFFKGTCICYDAIERAHYTIKAIGTDMKDMQDLFLSFYLNKKIDCIESEEFGVICEQ